MPKCGAKKECPVDDAITLDELKTENCIAFESDNEDEDNDCTSCENVVMIRNANKKLFDKNPIQKLFAKEPKTRSQTLKLRELLKVRCNIDSKEPPADEPLAKIFTINLIAAKKDLTIIHQTLQKLNNKGYREYLELLISILTRVAVWNQAIDDGIIDNEQRLARIMKDDILNFINELKIKNIGGAHDPRAVVLGIQNYLHKLAISTPMKMVSSLHLLANQPAACFEGSISTSENILYS